MAKSRSHDSPDDLIDEAWLRMSADYLPSEEFEREAQVIRAEQRRRSPAKFWLNEIRRWIRERSARRQADRLLRRL